MLLNNQKLIYTINELKDLKLSYYKINQLVEENKLRKINRKYYENAEYTGEYNELCLAQAYVERGVICMLSAASYYGLTSVRPLDIDIAIHRKDKVYSMPEWPMLAIRYYSDKRFETGVVEVRDSYDMFKIYDLEKTVVDIIYFREKVGIEEMKEIIHNYLRRNDKKINNLIRYSKELGCEDVVRRYMEVLL